MMYSRNFHFLAIRIRYTYWRIGAYCVLKRFIVYFKFGIKWNNLRYDSLQYEMRFNTPIRIPYSYRKEMKITTVYINTIHDFFD